MWQYRVQQQNTNVAQFPKQGGWLPFEGVGRIGGRRRDGDRYDRGAQLRVLLVLFFPKRRAALGYCARRGTLVAVGALAATVDRLMRGCGFGGSLGAKDCREFICRFEIEIISSLSEAPALLLAFATAV